MIKTLVPHDISHAFFSKRHFQSAWNEIWNVNFFSAWANGKESPLGPAHGSRWKGAGDTMHPPTLYWNRCWGSLSLWKGRGIDTHTNPHTHTDIQRATHTYTHTHPHTHTQTDPPTHTRTHTHHKHSFSHMYFVVVNCLHATDHVLSIFCVMIYLSSFDKRSYVA